MKRCADAGLDIVQTMVRRNRRQYGAVYDRLRFPTPEIAAAAGQSRTEALDRLLDRGLSLSCKQTKLHGGPLSPGCRECAAGSWSCLFVNGVCNANCFFCPKEAREHAVAVAEGIRFPTVGEYVAYLAAWNCRGVSVSGGEPLLSWDRTVNFTSGVRAQLGDGVHLWLYTNGKLATIDRLRAMKAAGVDEIRFNIAARDYRIDGLEDAARLFDTVVVEIPVIPEDVARVKRLIPRLEEAGVKYLNLHQLWASEKSVARLARRDYTMLHGPWISVLESELAALDLLDFTFDSCSALAAHYCSSAFKQRYQTMATLKRHAASVTRPWEEVTEAGLIRTRWIGGPRQKVMELVRAYEQTRIAGADYCWDERDGRLLFRGKALQSSEQNGLSCGLRYDITHVAEGDERTGALRRVMLSQRRALFVDRTPVFLKKALTAAELRSLELSLARDCGESGEPDPQNRDREADLDLAFLEKIDEYEWLEEGLPRYY